MDIQKLILGWLGSLSRTAIAAFSGYLIKAGYVAVDKGDSAEAITAGTIALVFALAWGAVNKYILHKQVAVAEVKAEIAESQVPPAQ